MSGAVTGAPLRALIVADGETAGGATAAAIRADPAFALLGRACEPEAVSALFATCEPDVVILYGGRDGGPRMAALERALAGRAAPVVTVDPARPEPFALLRERLRAAAGRAAPAPARAATKPARLIAIGSSTGGVEALVQLLSRFPADAPPTVVVQHMPPSFTTSFAARLDALCAPTVREAWDGAPLEPGVIYVAPGGPAHLEVQWTPARRVRLTPSEPVNRHRPSVDVAFASIARAGVQGVVGVLLTGMGRDGAEGLKLLRAAGARTIAQDRETSTVYGMPRAALEIGAVDFGTPLDRIAAAIFETDRLQKEAS